ncbi:lipoyl synthase [Citrobacter koseri]|uniref:Lipoyl synthase n=1 Tax=Citrobacter koseri TaxID=545 RepID=A0A2X2V7Q8_CITKO|nr:lipoyl synthase [Citrobacter koseri]
MSKPIVMERGVKYRDADKMALIPVKNVATEREALLRKPEWMKIKLPADSTRIQGIKSGNAQKWPAFCLRGSLLP